MSKVESLENEVVKLSPQALAAFREWFAKDDADAWDRQIESDVKAGKLDRLAPGIGGAWCMDGAKPRHVKHYRDPTAGKPWPEVKAKLLGGR